MCGSSGRDLGGGPGGGLDPRVVGGPADDVLGDGQVDDPAHPEAQVEDGLAGAEQGGADPLGEHLGAGTEGECVRAGHPGAVTGDVPAADGGEAEDDAG